MNKSLLKRLSQLSVILLFGTSTLSHAQMNFSLTPSSNTVCGGTPSNPITNPLGCVLTNTVSGATYYTYTLSSGNAITGITWTGSVGVIGSTTNINALVGTTGVFTITGLAYASVSSSVILSSVTTTIMALAGPNIAVAGPGTVCPNSVNTYTASGANTYTWFASTGTGTYSINGGAVASMTAGSLATFSVRGTAGNGCTNSTVFSPSIGSTTVTASSNTICAGNTATLSASGASTYTWSNGSVFPTIIVSPSVTTIYTLSSTNLGCTTTSTIIIAVANLPVLNASASQTICSGNVATLTASGANAYTWTPGNLTSASVMVSPSAAMCYTLIGSNGTNCNASTVVCVAVNASPTVSVVSSGSVCTGSSVSFTASGANSYTWSNSSVGNTLSVIPITSGIYTVLAGHTLNSCVKSATFTAFVSPSCAIVWPGDANRDGQVSNLDVLELGLAAGATGAARTSTSIAWTAQYASAWAGTVSTGWNKVHADCNGDGVINSSDNAAVTANFSLTHAFKSGSTSANPDITLVPQQVSAYEGVWNKANIILGDANNNLTQLYGLAFEIGFEQTKIQTDSVKIIYASSFLNAGNQNIEFSKAIFVNGKVYGASVRTDHSNISGNGKIGEFWYKLKSGLPANSSIQLSVNGTQKTNSNGIFIGLSNDAGTSVNISSNVTGIVDERVNTLPVVVHPNPASGTVRFTTDGNLPVVYKLSDVMGKQLISGEFKGNTVVDLTNLPAGNYFITFVTSETVRTQKLVVFH